MMFRPISYIRQSLPIQITLWVVGVAVVIIGICLFMIVHFAETFHDDTGYNRLLSLGVILAVISLIVITALVWLLVTRHLKPLQLLAGSMQRIADGQMEERIKDGGHPDEIGQLQTNFAVMQRALANYLFEMEQKRSTLSRQNDELQAAYEQAQESDNIKTQFLNRMSGQMLQNVESLTALTDTICDHYNELTKAEIMKMQVEMISYTDTVTMLLNKMLHTSKENDAL